MPNPGSGDVRRLHAARFVAVLPIGYEERRNHPLLSCWERQAEGVDQGSERGAASLKAVGVREWHQREPGQEQTGPDGGLEQQAAVVEVRLPPGPGVPGGMGVQRRGQERGRRLWGRRLWGRRLWGRRLWGRRLWGRRAVAQRGEGGTLQADERVGAQHQLPPARDGGVVGDAVIRPAQVIFGLFAAIRGSGVRTPNVLLMCPTVCSIVAVRLVMRTQGASGGRVTGSVVSWEERRGVRVPGGEDGRANEPLRGAAVGEDPGEGTPAGLAHAWARQQPHAVRGAQGDHVRQPQPVQRAGERATLATLAIQADRQHYAETQAQRQAFFD